ncbi:MAG: MarC family protein [Candidatus Latescibacterota bacterium]
MDFLTNSFVAFTKIAVAVDIPGILPVYLALVDAFRQDQRREVIRVGLITSFLTGLVFLFLGRAILDVLVITLIDFQFGGGLILVIMGVQELLGGGISVRRPSEAMGVVPIGVPLIIGPAVISIMVLSIDQHGLFPTLIAFTANVALVGFVFHYSIYINRVLGNNGMKVVSKVIMILLIALGMKMIRTGIIYTFGQLG